MMNQQVHLALQIVPIKGDPNHYSIIDKAIEVIEQSGFKYAVGPMETVIEGPFHKVMQVALDAQQKCFEHGAEELIVTIKIHIRKNADITWNEKMAQYTNR